MSAPVYQRGLHLFAIITVCVMLTTLAAGALVTSKNAGMAFRDWPTSDGQAMLSYPWMQDYARDWDKFLEHGHRLAGVMIGCFAIGLVGFAHAVDSRPTVRVLSLAFLAAVIIQGILGGFRVWLDERGLAMIHGAFACLVASILCTLVTILGRQWIKAEEQYDQAQVEFLKPMAVISTAILATQYLLGGYVRHHGTALHEHLGLGLLALLVVVGNAIASQRSGIRWLKGSGWGLLAILLLQVGLGAAAWIAKWGYTPTGYVATADSIHQVTLRTAHMVVGIFVVAFAWIHLLRVFRVASVSRATHPLPGWTMLTGMKGGTA